MHVQNNLDAILNRLQSGRHSEADIQAIVIALGDRAVAIGGDANNAIIITGDNNTVNGLYELPPEIIRILRARANQQDQRPVLSSFLILVSGWILISFLISWVISAYSENIAIIIAQSIGIIFNSLNQLLPVYYQLIIMCLGALIMFQFRPGKTFLRWFVAPIVLFLAFSFYQSIVVWILSNLHSLASSNSLQLFGIILSIYSSLGIVGISSNRLNIIQNPWGCIVYPFLTIIQFHVWGIGQIIRQIFQG